ncbi:class III extradiol ring-cleavage dioxygenase family protein [Nocardiopsis aegyptia]|uniref:Aromatic ring-opening dioxygenase LigB subunit n=1 Tax=Nocardiopsis aegyptia TaxID=220378 RepID=A0A7Z0EJR4_9ACTN|nr:hypothetical protein [Nocardiopsis aegyptia]NYJ33159.1 aromatic ring-opening dioxygenase LigB subunit [Nocardiopsis aegyptia]
MIVGTAVCPHPPLLLRELTGGQDVAAELRKACEEALASLVALGPEVVVVVGGADTGGRHEPGPAPVGAFGGAGARSAEGALPLSLGVAGRLLDAVGGAVPVEMYTVAFGAGPDAVAELARAIADRPERVGLLVMGDGSARRGVKAPGHLDERAFDFDERVRRALAGADPSALSGLEPDLAAELWVAGRAALQVMADAVARGGASYRSEVLYADDPFGVMYTVAVWSCDC